MSFKSKITDEVFIELWNKLGSPTLVAEVLKMNPRSIMARRKALEIYHSIELPTFNSQRTEKKPQVRKIHQTHGHVRRGIEIPDKGRVIVFSDAHFLPGEVSTAYKVLLLMIKEFKGQLKAVVANGDMMDGAGQISSHPRMGWEDAPTAKEEIEYCQEMMSGIEKVTPNQVPLIWTAGNHDARLTNYISRNAPALEGLPMTQLKDFFPLWKSCYSFWVNEDTCIKHRWKGGFGATRSNSLNSGVNFITGHTHNLSAFPITDFSPAFNLGTRWGVQTGCLADPHSAAFLYAEDSPKDWRSGLVLLSWENGRMLMPELVMVSGEDEFEFRGCINKV